MFSIKYIYVYIISCTSIIFKKKKIIKYIFNFFAISIIYSHVNLLEERLVISKQILYKNVPLAIRITLITRMMVGFIGMIFDSTSSNVMPTMDSMTIPMSSMFHLRKKVIQQNVQIKLSF